MTYYVPGARKVIVRTEIADGIAEDNELMMDYDDSDHNLDLVFSEDGQLLESRHYFLPDEELSFRYELEYNDQRLITKMSQYSLADNRLAWEAVCRYDEQGRMVEKVNSWSSFGKKQEWVTWYQYFGLTKRVSGRDCFGNTISGYESKCNDFKQETLWKYINEKGEYQGRMEFSYLPDGGSLTCKSAIDENERLVYQMKFTYQENGLMSSDSYQGGGFIEVWNYQYGYDSLGIWVYKGYYQEGVLLFYSERDVEYW
jgi:hypothetical protein